MLRDLINIQVDEKHQIPTADVALKRAEQQQRNKAKAERMAARARARAEAVSNG